jgi:hypothetical protein
MAKKKKNPIAKITDSRDLYAIGEKKIARKNKIRINKNAANWKE